MTRRPLLIYAASEFGRVVRHLAEDCGYSFAGFIDDWKTGPEILGPWASVRATYRPTDYAISMAIGYRHLRERWALYQALLADGYDFPRLIHPRAITHRSAQLGNGTIAMAGAVVDVDVLIGDLCVLWPGAVVSHDSRVADNCFLSPNATTCGATSIGAGSFIGAGAVIADHTVVPPGSFCKAGSVHHGRRST